MEITHVQFTPVTRETVGVEYLEKTPWSDQQDVRCLITIKDSDADNREILSIFTANITLHLID